MANPSTLGKRKAESAKRGQSVLSAVGGRALPLPLTGSAGRFRTPLRSAVSRKPVCTRVCDGMGSAGSAPKKNALQGPSASTRGTTNLPANLHHRGGRRMLRRGRRRGHCRAWSAADSHELRGVSRGLSQSHKPTIYYCNYGAKLKEPTHWKLPECDTANLERGASWLTGAQRKPTPTLELNARAQTSPSYPSAPVQTGRQAGRKTPGHGQS